MPKARNSPNSPIDDGNKPGKGRPPGSRNKTTRAIHQASLLAAEAIGEDGKGLNGVVGYLTWLGKNEPASFAAILGKLIPLQVVGSGGGPLRVIDETTTLAERQQRFADDLKAMRLGQMPARLVQMIEHRAEEMAADKTDDDEEAA